MTRADRAVALHNGGAACSQAVFSVFAEELGLPPGAALRVATGFGGGIGRLGLTCGAVTGGVLALSLAFGNETGDDQERKLDTYGKVADFMKAMSAAAGASDCRTLLGGIDLWTEEGRAKMKAGGLSSSMCNRLIRLAVERVESTLTAAGKLRPPRAEPEAAAGAAPAEHAPAAGRTVEIRRARAGDAPVLAEFRYRMFADMDAGADWSARRDAVVEKATGYFAEKADSPGQLNYLAFVDGKPAASACAILDERPPHVRYDGTGYAYVHSVYVVPELRGAGIAKALMRRLHSDAALAGVVKFGLHASHYGRPLYLDLGYGIAERYMERSK